MTLKKDVNTQQLYNKIKILVIRVEHVHISMRLQPIDK